MSRASTNRVVHLELHTGDLGRARAFYSELCGWRAERIETARGSYLAVELGGTLGGGIVECGLQRARWLPYVEVDEIHLATERARALGGLTLLEPREGPGGWRSVLSTPIAGEVAFWQPKR
jgi:predicted enzyme related to lactoylglutathione lyase